ncbi:30S ribosomal protein S4 [Candidatus Thorarchaeota archaeon]|nr:MAG: 30S ribosomal protein S4 [Candidatus Thorarchaeota archaeon]
MGDPRRQKKKYVVPKRPFDTDRFEEELQLIGNYGLRNKRELWRHSTELSNYRRQARTLLALPPSERQQTEKELVDKLVRIGVLEQPSLDHVLDLTLENVLDRRLQTLVFRKGMAASMHHARQLVSHGHIALDNARVTTPARLMTVGEEDRITYTMKSALNDQSHPARIAASDAATRVVEPVDDYDERPRGRDDRRGGDRRGGGRRDDSRGAPAARGPPATREDEAPVTDDEVDPIGDEELE